MSKARQLADNGAASPNRNMVINGAMNVAQRATSVTGIGGNAESYPTVDRIKIGAEGTTAGRLTMTQTADGPVGISANCMKFACTTADTSIAAAELVGISTSLEGQNVQRLSKGVSGAKKSTISFYVRGNAAATYACELFDGDNSRHIVKLFAVTTSWNRIEFSIPADEDDGSSALDDDNAASLTINFWIHGGSNFTGGTLATAWANKVNANRAAGISSFFDATSRTLSITGLQFEVGEAATPFEHKTFGQDLAECQRYCQRFPATDQEDDGDGGVSGRFSNVGYGYADSTTTGGIVIPLVTTMRLEPTATVSGSWRFIYLNQQVAITSGPTMVDEYSSKSFAAFTSTVGSTALTAGDGIALTQSNDVDANIILDSEL